MANGAKYCLLEPHYRGDLMARQLGDVKDVLDTVGRDNVPKNWDGRNAVVKDVAGRGALAVFQWFPEMSRPGFIGENQPVVDVSWYHGKGWVLSQDGLYLLTDAQWEWSAQGGEEKREYATPNGQLFDEEGKKLAHCSMRTEEKTTVNVDDPRYAAGPFELRHKTGEVWEWVERNPAHRNQFGLRGGSWFNDNAGGLRVAYRLNYGPGLRDRDVGFRVGAAVPQDS